MPPLLAAASPTFTHSSSARHALFATMAEERVCLPSSQAHRIQQASKSSLGFRLSHHATPLYVVLTPPSSKMGHILVNFSNALYSAIRLCAPHVSLPDRSRCETADRARVCCLPPSITQETAVTKPLVAQFKMVRNMCTGRLKNDPMSCTDGR